MNWCSEPLNRAEGEGMDKETKRFTISVSQEFSRRLRALQQTEYPECSQNEMLVDLIRKGLDAAESGAFPPQTKRNKK